MCIIAIKKRGNELFSKQIIKNCFENNDDGAGYMFVANNKVVVKKGFMNFKELYKNIKRDYNRFNLKDKHLVLHCRLSTSNRVNKVECHPFPLSNDKKALHSLYIKSDCAMVHNGVFYDYKPTDIFNDTQVFVKDFLTDVWRCNLKQNIKNKIVNAEIGTYNKVAILDKNDNLFTFGNFVDDNDGNKYSNTGYLDKISYYTSSYSSACDYPTYYSDYDWDDYSFYNTIIEHKSVYKKLNVELCGDFEILYKQQKLTLNQWDKNDFEFYVSVGGYIYVVDTKEKTADFDNAHIYKDKKFLLKEDLKALFKELD